MYACKDIVVYKNMICEVQAIGDLKFAELPQRCYYTLKPLKGKGIFYIPIDLADSLRSILNKDEAMKLIDSLPDVKTGPYLDSSQNKLKDYYKQMFNAHNCVSLAAIIKTAYEKDIQVQKKGRVLSQADTQSRKAAEDSLYQELSLALGIPIEQVPNFIESRIGKLLNA
ncbi:MAG: hypothetical protein HGA54_05790 [Actinobacteria bacterium]|nr:hypothetical protein [Actinomycetota bacterium]